MSSPLLTFSDTDTVTDKTAVVIIATLIDILQATTDKDTMNTAISKVLPLGILNFSRGDTAMLREADRLLRVLFASLPVPASQDNQDPSVAS